jgi:hypothetical protein
MYTAILNFALRYPKGIETAGGVIVRIAGIALGLGYFLHALGSTLLGMSSTAGPMTAQRVLPGLPTWWVPESALGAALWAAVLGVGVVAIIVGRDVRQQLRAIR